MRYICSDHGHSKNKLYKLLQDTPEKWYWLGFLIGDGYFSSNGRLKLVISSIDREHLERLAAFCGCGNIHKEKGGAYLRWSVMDVNTVGYLKHIYQISNRKTYNPCDLSGISPFQLKCLSVGFIDADGSIQTQYGRDTTAISIKGHGSWVDNFNLMFNKGYVDNSGYATACIGDFKEQKELKVFGLKNKLPILKRKWDKIDLNLKTRKESFEEQKLEVVDRLSRGWSNSDILQDLGVKPQTVYYIKRNYL